MTPVERLLAIDAIRQLKSRYFRLMDLREWAILSEVFCRNAVFDCTDGLRCFPIGGEPRGPIGPVTRGRGAIVAWIARSFADRVSIHHGHGHEIWIDGESEAHGIVAMEDRIRDLDRTREVLHAAGHYHEHYRIEDGAWRIAHTRLTRLFNDAAGEGVGGDAGRVPSF